MDNPFVCDAGVDKPGIVGSRWWNKALNESSSLHTRRSSLGTGLVVAGLVLLGGATVWAVASASSGDDDEETKEERRRSLELQKDYGWNFGVVSETVVFDVQYTQAYAREALARLESDLAPKDAANLKYYVPTLFQSPEAVPRLTLPDGDTTRVKPLAEALRPILTPTMRESEKRGAAYAALVASADSRVVTIIDLAGPDAVAFASGAATILDPIFLFDNWPHPRGVVPAHLTLAAATYYQPQLAKAKAERRAGAPSMFVIERARLNPYTDDATQFDNRYAAKLPVSAVANADKVLYVVPTQANVPEQDDLNTQFSDWVKAGVEVRAIAADAFFVGGDKATFGTTPEANASFFAHYPWKKPAPPLVPVPTNEKTAAYRPVARPAAATSVDPTTIGLASVVIGVGSGLLLGSKLNRSGTRNRTYSSYGGG